MRRASLWAAGLVWLSLVSVCSGSGCLFPPHWHGKYFHLGFHDPLVVANNTISNKGKCVENIGSQYVMEEEEYGEKCWRCMSIYRKHQNVLQYKESYCETYFDTFASLCMGIAGDSPMYSMFRKEATPVRCPFKGPFTFRYTKGGSGSMCGYPLSYLDSCTDNTKLQVNFQACIDVQGSESSAEQFQCLATWKEGSKRYMVAEMNRDHVYSDESKYRCFVYEKHGKGDNQTVHMAQSVAATCNGLWSPTEGFRTYDMKKVSDASNSKCSLPRWVTQYHLWRSLDGSVIAHINNGERSFKLKNLQDVVHPEESHITCQSIVRKERDFVKLVSYVKSGCDSGFMCSVFREQTDGVVLAQFGLKARTPGEACSHMYFSHSSRRSVLLVARSLAVDKACPLSGRYQLAPLATSPAPALSTCSSTFSMALSAGCGSSRLEVETLCESSVKLRNSYQCRGHWYERGTTKVILSSHTSEQLLCLSYTDRTGSVNTNSCQVDVPQFNLTETGPCLQALSSVSAAPSHTLPGRLLPPLLTYLLVVLCQNSL